MVVDAPRAARARCALALGAAGLALLASGCAPASEQGSGHGPDADGASTSPRGSGAERSLKTRQARRAGPPVAERPVGLRLPSGTDVPVEAAATGGDGVLQVPDDVDHAGWWRGGARLGDPFGSTLVAGHVDATDQGLGAFAELLSVRAGQRVRVRSGHLEQVFTIRSRRLVPRGELRTQPGIYSVHGARRLTLVTCAPPYLRDRGGYQNLAVVTAVPATSVEGRGER